MCFAVIAFIGSLAVSAASIPRPRGRGTGISIPLTKHSPSLNSNKSVNIDGKFKSRAMSYTTKLLRGAENYKRDTETTHPSALNLRSGSQNWKSGAAGLDLTPGPDDDVWYGTISIGTPPKLFTVQIDTGSSDLFIPASTGNEFCKSHDNLWNSASSTTAKNLYEPFEIEFGDGATANGQLYADTINIAGFTVDKQTIGVATAYSVNLAKDHFPADGMLGLGFQSISVYPASPLLETLVTEGKLPNAVFSFKLAHDGGEMYIGGMNKELYTGDITFVNVQSKEYWEVIVDDIRINEKPVLKDVVTIIDSGSNYISGDPDRVFTLHKSRGGKAFENGWYTFPCDDFPDVTFTIGGKPFTIFADDLDFGPVEYGSPDCFSGIRSRLQDGVEHWNVGTDFLQRFYTVFNMDSNPPQVGFAHLAEL